MIISRTPYRLSFFGGGTDYPDWYRKHGGAVLATTIDKYCYLTCRFLPPFFEHKHRIVWSRIETCNRLEDIQHPSVREILRFLEIERGVEIHHVGDLPARSGMGSSSAFSVGLLHAVHALKGFMPTKEQLAREGIHVEQELLRETVGSQDQVMAANGGFNHVRFLPGGEFSVSPVILPKERLTALNDHLMLFYTGIKRTASSVADSYALDLEARRDQLQAMQGLVEESLGMLNGRGAIAGFGELLDRGWRVKRAFSAEVSNPEVDGLYRRARETGAIGGKLVGAGGGGFLLLFVEPEAQDRVKRSLEGLIHVPFQFDFTGSQIISYSREEDYSKAEGERSAMAIGPFRELRDDGGAR